MALMDCAGGARGVIADRARAALRAYAAGLALGAGRRGQPTDPAAGARWEAGAVDEWLGGVEADDALRHVRSAAEALGLLTAPPRPDGHHGSDGRPAADAGRGEAVPHLGPHVVPHVESHVVPHLVPHGAPHDETGDDGDGRAGVEDACLAGLLLGIAYPHDPLGEIVERAQGALSCAPRFEDVRASAPLQATVAAVAAVVSSGLAGADWDQRVAFAAWAADEGGTAGSYRPGPRLSARLTWACALAARAEADPVDVLALLVGNSGLPQECVPAGLALAAVSPDVGAAQAGAFALGGATDVITALAGSLAAAGGPPGAPTAAGAAGGSGAGAGRAPDEACPWSGLVAHLLAHRGP